MSREIREALEKLLVLQEKDQRLRQLLWEQDKLPLERQEIEKRLQKAKQTFENDTASLRENEVARKKLELNVQSKEEAVRKYKTQQMQTRKNEEFQALSHEIETAEQAISDLETEELELMEQADELRAHAAEAKKVLDAAEGSYKDQIDAIEKREVSLRDRIAEIETERAAHATEVDEDLLDLYTRIMKNKKDSTVVPLEHGVCGGCHMKITTSLANAVKAADSIQHCEYCGRILYDSFS